MLNTSFSAAELKGVLDREQPRVLVYDEEFASIVGDASPPGTKRVATGTRIRRRCATSSSRPRSTRRPRRAGW